MMTSLQFIVLYKLSSDIITWVTRTANARNRFSNLIEFNLIAANVIFKIQDYKFRFNLCEYRLLSGTKRLVFHRN